MADLELRPRFALDVPCRAEAIVEALREALAAAEPPLEGRCDPGHCVLRVPRARRRFWSPELDLTFEPFAEQDAGAGVRVRCLFAPRPPVWTGFAFVYALLGVATVAAGVYGLAQLGLGQAPWAFAAAGAALALVGLVYAAAFVGQGLSAGQMYELRRVLDAAVERAVERARAAPRTALDSARL